LVDRLAASDAAGALAKADESLGGGYAPDYWCSLLISHLRDLMIMRVCGDDTDMVDAPAAMRPKLAAQCKSFDGSAYVYMITMLEELRRSVKSSGSARALIEAAIVRLAEAAKFSSIETLLGYVESGEGPATSAPSRAPSPRPQAKAPTPAETERPPASPSRPAPSKAESNKRAASPASGSSAPPPKSMTQADLHAAHAQPEVQAALELFGGRVVHVVRSEETDSDKSDQG
jgi:DNA polymerase III gamma/tau subunit